MATKKKSKPTKKAAPKKAAPKKAAPKKAKKATAQKSVAARSPKDALLGKAAPVFSLSDQDGTIVTSRSLAKRPYVLYFYPKDDTPGCTKEACDFRDGFGKFARAGVVVLGVSPDSVASHGRFRQKYSLPFTLLSDVDKKLANAYGVWVKKQNYGREYMGIARSTFLVDGKGVIRHAWRGVKVDGHADAVLARVRELG